MLSTKDNGTLAQVGAGTPMGNLLRSFPIPILISTDLPQVDGQPYRLRLFGENLVAFRDTKGRVGLLDERCPHRGASLAFGRNEECGLRCVYHGWKFNVDGECVDIPSSPASDDIRRRVRAKGYPCVERNGIIWAYLGHGAMPPIPDIEWGLLDEEQRYVSRRVYDCNWAQALEGDIDTSHASFLHGRLSSEDFDRFDRARAMRYMDVDGSPVFEVVDMPYGVMVAARRMAEHDSYYWRISQFLFPFFTMPAPYEDMPFRCNVWVPMDDEHTIVWTIDWHPERAFTSEELANRNSGLIGHCVDFLPVSPEPYGRFLPKANRVNDYLSDYGLQRTEQFSSIPGVWAQDKAMAESMGAITDREREFLLPSDTAIVRWRRRMIAAARALESDNILPAQDPAVYLVRSASLVLPRAEQWQESVAAHTKAGRDVPIHTETV